MDPVYTALCSLDALLAVLYLMLLVQAMILGISPHYIYMHTLKTRVGGGNMSSETGEFPGILCNHPTLMETHSHSK